MNYAGDVSLSVPDLPPIAFVAVAPPERDEPLPGTLLAATDELDEEDKAIFRGDPLLRLYTYAWPSGEQLPAQPPPDGQGIAAVTFTLFLPDGGTFTRREQLAPYCLFGGDNRCDRWDFAAHGCRWPTDDLGGTSEVEWDHKAFLWWDETDLAVVPVVDLGGVTGNFVGAVGLDVSRDGVREIGRIEHPMAVRPAWSPPNCPPGADCVPPPTDVASGEIVARGSYEELVD